MKMISTIELVKMLRENEALPATNENLAEGQRIYEELKRRAENGDREARRAVDYGL